MEHTSTNSSKASFTSFYIHTKSNTSVTMAANILDVPRNFVCHPVTDQSQSSQN
jgi:hypothetical protein